MLMHARSENGKKPDVTVARQSCMRENERNGHLYTLCPILAMEHMGFGPFGVN